MPDSLLFLLTTSTTESDPLAKVPKLGILQNAPFQPGLRFASNV